MTKKEKYIVLGDGQPIYIDKAGEGWKGGGNSVHIPIFSDNGDAMRFRKKIQRKWKDKPYACDCYYIRSCEVYEYKEVLPPAGDSDDGNS